MRTINELNWREAKEAFANTDLALIPVGAVEVYGPHLPLGSDGLVALEISKRLAERTGAVVLPLVPVGDSRSLLSFPGTLTVSPAALKAYLKDLCESVRHWGIRRILFINGHAGNVAVIGDIAAEYVGTGVRVAQVNCWQALEKAAPDVPDTGALANRHAGEIGTSVLLAVRPDLVQLGLEGKVIPPPSLATQYPEVNVYDIPFSSNTQTGQTGDATTANVQKGVKMLDRLLERLLQFVNDWKAG